MLSILVQVEKCAPLSLCRLVVSQLERWLWGQGRTSQQPGLQLVLPALFTSGNLKDNETIDALGALLLTASSTLRPAGAALNPSRQLQFSFLCCEGGRDDRVGAGVQARQLSHTDAGGAAARRQRPFPPTGDATLVRTCQRSAAWEQ